MNTEKMTAYGIDCSKGLKICMGSEDIYKKILTMFLNDPCFTKAKKAHLDGNQDELFGLLHELKGTSGNAALIDLYEKVVPLVELLRKGNADTKEVDTQFAALEAAYVRAAEGIEILLAE